MNDDELLRRGSRTALACWAAIAAGADGATVLHRPGVGIGVFPAGPERAVYNNAILALALGAAERAAAIAAMEDAYAAAGVERYAAWTHEADRAMQRDLERRGYTLAETTRAMGMTLDAHAPTAGALDLAPPDWSEYLRILEVPAGLLERVDPAHFHVLIARHDGAGAATGMAFDHDGDAGVYNVATLDHARGRGLGTALTARLVGDAAARGCTTATLHATEMGERVYAAVGFRDLGRVLEFASPERRG
jgi:ribosomal protein S18 acetylase RimI-like enzyme